MPDMYGNPRTFGSRGKARKEGAAAYKSGLRRINPYDELTDSGLHRDWDAGYDTARHMAEIAEQVKQDKVPRP